MGGRLDATNVIKAPLACIITSISLDHTAYLGTTIREIAGEKAGIIKAGVPVIYDGHDAAAAEVIRGKAEAMGSPSFCLKPEVYRAVKVDSTGTAFDYRMPDGEIVRLKIPQIAEYQMMNASLAYFTLRVLSDRIRIGGKNLEEGLLHMYWPCRMETVADRVVIDGAHNADGVAEFVKTVQHFRTEGEITLLFSAVADKRYAAMIGELVEGIRPEHVVTTKISGSREVSEDRLAQLFRDAGCADVRSYPTPGEAYEAALGIRGTGWLFCVGSLYLAGELKKYIAK